jgi:hypothetical protein
MQICSWDCHLSIYYLHKRDGTLTCNMSISNASAVLSKCHKHRDKSRYILSLPWQDSILVDGKWREAGRGGYKSSLPLDLFTSYPETVTRTWNILRVLMMWARPAPTFVRAQLQNTAQAGDIDQPYVTASQLLWQNIMIARGEEDQITCE